MTIKELADVAGCNERTVRRIGKDMFPDVFRNGVKTIFTKDQCFDIMSNLPKRNLVQMSEQPNTNVQAVNYEVIGKMIGMAVSAALTPVVDRLDKLSEYKSVNKAKQLEAPKMSDRDRLNKIVNDYSLSHFDGDRREAWNSLYQEIYYRMHKNVRLCAKNRDMKKLDYIESEGLLTDSIAIVNELISE